MREANYKFDLKECPFCGGRAKLINEVRGVTVENKVSYVMCDDCMASTKMFQISTRHSSDEKAVEAWNRREGEHNG